MPRKVPNQWSAASKSRRMTRTAGPADNVKHLAICSMRLSTTYWLAALAALTRGASCSFVRTVQFGYVHDDDQGVRRRRAVASERIDSQGRGQPVAARGLQSPVHFF